jgi:hypothetical protein
MGMGVSRSGRLRLLVPFPEPHLLIDVEDVSKPGKDLLFLFESVLEHGVSQFCEEEKELVALRIELLQVGELTLGLGLLGDALVGKAVAEILSNCWVQNFLFGHFMADKDMGDLAECL